MSKNAPLDSLIQNVESASNFFLTCSNPRRLLILCFLSQKNRLNVSELGKLIPEISQSALSQHLAILRSENLVSVEKEGLSVYYEISDPNIKKILTLFKEIYCK